MRRVRVPSDLRGRGVWGRHAGKGADPRGEAAEPHSRSECLSESRPSRNKQGRAERRPSLANGWSPAREVEARPIPRPEPQPQARSGGTVVQSQWFASQSALDLVATESRVSLRSLSQSALSVRTRSAALGCNPVRVPCFRPAERPLAAVGCAARSPHPPLLSQRFSAHVVPSPRLK